MTNLRKNKDFNPRNCPVTHFMNKVGGKWKTLIMYAITMKYNRFSLLQRCIPLISKQMLVNQLRELENDGIIEKKIYAETPPRVEYTLTAYGESIMPILRNIQDWGIKDMKEQEIWEEKTGYTPL